MLDTTWTMQCLGHPYNYDKSLSSLFGVYRLYDNLPLRALKNSVCTRHREPFYGMLVIHVHHAQLVSYYDALWCALMPYFIV